MSKSKGRLDLQERIRVIFRKLREVLPVQAFILTITSTENNTTKEKKSSLQVLLELISRISFTKNKKAKE